MAGYLIREAHSTAEHEVAVRMNRKDSERRWDHDLKQVGGTINMLDRHK
jgi:hypothetical protein